MSASLRTTGFLKQKYTLLIWSDNLLQPAEIPFQVTPFRNPNQTDGLAISIAGLIFSLIRNPSDQVEYGKVTEALGVESASAIAELSKEAELGLGDRRVTGIMKYGKGQKRCLYSHPPDRVKVNRLDTAVACAIAKA